MATVVADGPPRPPGADKEVYATVTIGTYATGGVQLDPEEFGLGEITTLAPLGVTTNGYSTRFVTATDKLMVFRTDQVDDPQEQVPDTTDLAAESLRVRVTGF